MEDEEQLEEIKIAVQNLEEKMYKKQMKMNEKM